MATPRKSDDHGDGASPAARAGQVAFVVVALAAVVTFGRAVRDGEQRRAPDALVRHLQPDYVGDNRRAPDFELQDHRGRPFRLSSTRGKVVVLHFWSRTCPPCIEELQRTIPVFDEIVRARSDIAFVMVSVDAGWDAVSALVPNGLAATMLFDPRRRVVTGQYGTRLFPETWVIDPQGVIRARFDHVIDWTSPILLDYLRSLR